MNYKNSQKVSRLSELNSSLSLLDSPGDTVLCYGSFNIIHPGHIRYFKQARDHGNGLYVAIDGDHILAKDLGGSKFSEQARADSLAALDIVDHVIILDTGELVDFVKVWLPKVLVLGNEFEGQRSAHISSALEFLEDQECRILYDAGEVQYASLDLFSLNQPDLEHKKLCQFKDILLKHEIDISNTITRLAGRTPKLLVVGDTIVDQYVACDAVGMSAEAPVLVVRELKTKEYLGGAAIVASHLQALGADCTYLSVVGKDTNAVWVRRELEEQKLSTHLFEDADRPTTFKIRYMVESQKLFRVSRLKEHYVSKEIEDTIVEQLELLAPEMQGIVVSDFVYGVISPRILGTIQRVADEHQLPLFGDIQCSSQVGNILKFKYFTLICPTEREARIALADNHNGLEWVANTLLDQTSSDNLMIKLGAEGFIIYEKEGDGDRAEAIRQSFPALIIDPVDVTGAGDALLSIMAFALSSGINLLEASALGTCVAALAVQSVGNVPITLSSLAKFIQDQNL